MEDDNNNPQINSQEESEEENINNLKVSKDEILTDSDIEDEKYQPTYTHPQNRILYRNHSSSNMTIQNNLNIEMQNKKIKEANNQILELKKLNQDYDIQLKNYKNEFVKLQEAYKTKESISREFQQVINESTNKFNKLEEKNSMYKKENENLKEKIAKLEKELQDERNKIKKNIENYKSVEIYQKQIKEMENEYLEKEKKLNQKYLDKNNKIKDDLMSEITKLTRQIDELKIENEKIKYDYSNQKIEIDTLQGKIDDKDFEHQSQLSKKEKELKKLNDKINEYEKTIKE